MLERHLSDHLQKSRILFSVSSALAVLQMPLMKANWWNWPNVIYRTMRLLGYHGWSLATKNSDNRRTLQSNVAQSSFRRNEKARARIQLMSKSMEKHIAKFRRSDGDVWYSNGRGVHFLFMSLTDVFKLELLKRFPESNPRSVDEVYEFARTIDINSNGREARNALQIRTRRFHLMLSRAQRRRRRPRWTKTPCLGVVPKRVSVTSMERKIGALNAVLRE